jgi:glycosyltransferase involved in cell wall biosynthesis
VPSLVEGSSRKLEGTCNVVFVCSYDEDEPVEEAIAAARQIDPSWRLYITGNYRRHVARFPSLASPPDTVKLTGFLTEGDYQTLLRSADVILALTTHDHTLMCVAYEAVSLVKPVVASDMSAMRAYFRRGFVFTENSAAAIAAALRSAVHQGQQLRSEATILRSELEADWNARFADLQHQIARRAS